MNQVLLFISRMVFIHYLSAAYLGVNGLFTDVLGILNLAELGIGTAMIYSLYEPAAKNDEHRLAQLMTFTGSSTVSWRSWCCSWALH